MVENSKYTVSLPPDRALFEGQLQGLVMTLYSNEKPPRGLAGMMDWHFHGLISDSIKNGRIIGKPGECVYFPVTRNGSTFHLFLLGSGQVAKNGERKPVPAESLEVLQKNLISLKLEKIGISKSDFGNLTTEPLNKQLKGISLWITP